MNIIYVSYGIPCVCIYLLTEISILSIRKKLNSTFVVIYNLTAAMVRVFKEMIKSRIILEPVNLLECMVSYETIQ